jgi:hypothetical protein
MKTKLSPYIQNLFFVCLIASVWFFSLPNLRAFASTFNYNSQPTFNGTYTATQWDATELAVKQTNASSKPGTYVSAVEDSTSPSTV